MKYLLLLLLTAPLEATTTADYLQYACWTHAAHTERIARVSAFVNAHRTESGTVTPPMVVADETVRRSAALLVYMRRVTFCSAHTLADKYPEDRAQQLYESAAFLVDVSYHFDSLYGEGGW